MNELSKNLLKNMAAYRLPKRCDEEGVFVVEGVKLCDEALHSGFHIRTVCGIEEWMGDHRASLPADSEKYTVTAEQLERLSLMRTPNKVWMLVERKAPATNTDASEMILALDGLQDPGNMGTLLRTADWYGIRQVVCGNDTVSCYNPKVVQASMGAIFRTEVTYCRLTDYLQEAVEKGYTVYGAMLDGESLYRSTLQKPAVLVVGNEGRGLSDTVAATVTRRLTIPNIGGTCESLNAAVAAAILMSEFQRSVVI